MPPDLEQITLTPHVPGSMAHGMTDAGDPSSSQYLPIPTQDFNQPSQIEGNFADGSDRLFSLYNEKAADYDQKLAENWREDAQGVMILSGLFSATVAGFLSQSYLGSLTSPQDVSAFYLSQIYQLQASLNNSVGLPLPIPPKPSSAPQLANVILFASLVLTLACAVFATLVQEWVRKYLIISQPRFSPRRRARIRESMTQEGVLVSLQRMVHILHTFLHLSIFFFLVGLIALASGGDPPVIIAVNFHIFLSLLLYLRYSLMPVFHPHSLYSTPFSGFLLSLRAVPRLGLSLFRAITRSDSPPKVQDSAPFQGGWLTLDWATLEVEKFADTQPSTLDFAAIRWLLLTSLLGQDQEMEQFLAGIPDFYASKKVEDPANVLRELNTDLLPKVIVSFMDRSLSSDLFSDITVQKRIRVSLRAMEVDPYLLQRTFHRALCSGNTTIFKCIDFVRLADRYTDDVDLKLCCLAKCIVAVAINRLENRGSDERWAKIVQRGLNWSQSQFAEYCGQRDSVKLRNLVKIARALSSAHLGYEDPSARAVIQDTLHVVRQLNVENASNELRAEFCELWNQLVGSIQIQDLLRDPVMRSNARLLLSLTRDIYISLHEGTNTRRFALVASTNGLDSNSATYALCNISTHRRSAPTPENTVAAVDNDQEA